MTTTRSANSLWLKKLQTLLGEEAKPLKNFARLCGKQQSNISAYLNSAKSPSNAVLRSCLRNIRSQWIIEPICEIYPITDLEDSWRELSGVYVVYDSGGNVMYIGKATKFGAELNQTLNRLFSGPRLGPKKFVKKSTSRLRDLAQYVSFYAVSNDSLRHNLEALLIRIFSNQTFNSNLANFRLP